MRTLAPLILLALSACAPKVEPLTFKQLTYHAVDCWGGELAHGGLRVQRYGEDAHCPTQEWLAEEWEFMQQRLLINDDEALSGLTIVYVSGTNPCSPRNTSTATALGCYKLIGGEPFAFVDQDITVATLRFAPPGITREPTWPATTFHEIMHHLMRHYGYDWGHDGALKLIEDRNGQKGVTFEYTERDRFVYQKLAKAIGGTWPRLRTPLDKRDPVRGRKAK